MEIKSYKRMQACGVMQLVQYEVSTPQSAVAADVAQHYVPPPPYFGTFCLLTAVNSKIEFCRPSHTRIE